MEVFGCTEGVGMGWKQKYCQLAISGWGRSLDLTRDFPYGIACFPTSFDVWILGTPKSFFSVIRKSDDGPEYLDGSLTLSRWNGVHLALAPASALFCDTISC